MTSKLGLVRWHPFVATCACNRAAAAPASPVGRPGRSGKRGRDAPYAAPTSSTPTTTTAPTAVMFTMVSPPQDTGNQGHRVTKISDNIRQGHETVRGEADHAVPEALPSLTPPAAPKNSRLRLGLIERGPASQRPGQARGLPPPRAGARSLVGVDSGTSRRSPAGKYTGRSPEAARLGERDLLV